MPLLQVTPAPTGEAFFALPPPLLLAVLALLPPDDRLRCAAVCRAWRSAVADHRVWQRLDLSPASGVAGRVTAARLRGYAALAGGQLQSLCVMYNFLLWADYVAVVEANAAMLTALTLPRGDQAMLVNVLKRLLRAAPHLLTAHVDHVGCGPLQARRLLRNKPPFGALKLQRLSVDYERALQADGPDDPPVPDVAADVAAHPSLSDLRLYFAKMDAPAAWAALVDAALAARLHTLKLFRCRVRPGAAAALARLLSSSNMLTQLVVGGSGDKYDEYEHGPGEVLLDTAADAEAMAAALRGNTTLTSLQLEDVQLWRDSAAASAFVAALAGHPSLASLRLHSADVDNARVALGEPLATLVMVNSPALHELDIGRGGVWGGVNEADAAGLGALFDALAHNTHLCTFVCRDDGLPDELVTGRLLPALAANRSLRKLSLGWEDATDAACSAMRLVDARAAAPDA